MKLKKELGLFDVFSIATGAMISSGLFVLPGLAHALAGPAVVLSYFLAGLLALTGLLSQAELVSAMPKTGGTYFYITRSMGPAAGTINGLLTWFSLALKSAFALVGMAAFTKIFISTNINLIAIILCIVFIIVNIIGVKEVGRIQRILVFGLLLILFYYVIKGIGSIEVSNFKPFVSNGIGAVFSTAGFVFISFGGLLKVASIAEEVNEPERTIPLGMILSLFVVIVTYTLVVFITSGVLGSLELDNSLTPISDGARSFLGNKGVILLNIAAILAFISTANAGIMAASRYPMALAKDRLLPSFFSKLNKYFKTPHIAILFTGGSIIGALFFDLSVLVKVASTVLISTFLFSCLAVIIMRESKVQNYQPKFISPLYPWIQIVGIIGFMLLIIKMGKEALIPFAVFIAVGFLIYWFYGKIRTKREYALLHLIERITAKELTSRSLERELKEIIRDRDSIVKDRFDSVVENCLILDLDKAMDYRELFLAVAEKLATRVKISKDEIYNLLIAREVDTSTVIAPGIAIPHIIITGEKIFDLVLVRSKAGVRFSDEKADVNTIFVLFGTKDERNFHLRALASIAQIIQSGNFKTVWLEARGNEELRDVILLGKRIR